MTGIENNSKKTVTAILPNYNYAKHIDRRIDEALNQTYPISELIILDDASTDDSITKLKQKLFKVKKIYPKLKLKVVINKKNSGNVFSQWQKGIKLATSDYIWICELDDSARMSFLKTVMSGFEDENVVLSYCNSRSIDKSGRRIAKEDLRGIKDIFRKKHIPGNYIIDGIDEIEKNLAVYNSIPNVSAVIFKKQAKLIDILDRAKKLSLCGDWFFYLEVAKTGKIAYFQKTLNSHRIHRRSVTSNTNLDDRLKEIKIIHRHVLRSLNISSRTKTRMAKLETYLAKKWDTEDNISHV